MKNLIFYKTTADFDNTGEVLIYKYCCPMKLFKLK